MVAGRRHLLHTVIATHSVPPFLGLASASIAFRRAPRRAGSAIACVRCCAKSNLRNEIDFPVGGLWQARLRPARLDALGHCDLDALAAPRFG
jgi:hypothetical protein